MEVNPTFETPPYTVLVYTTESSFCPTPLPAFVYFLCLRYSCTGKHGARQVSTKSSVDGFEFEVVRFVTSKVAGTGIGRYIDESSENRTKMGSTVDCTFDTRMERMEPPVNITFHEINNFTRGIFGGKVSAKLSTCIAIHVCIP